MEKLKFSNKKEEFDDLYRNKEEFEAIVPVNLEINKPCKIKGKMVSQMKNIINGSLFIQLLIVVCIIKNILEQKYACQKEIKILLL